MDSSNFDSSDQTKVLARLRLAQVSETINGLLAQIQENADAMLNTTVTFQDLAWSQRVRLPAPADTRPRADFDQERRAKNYRIGGLAAQVVGVVLFATLGQYSLNVDAPGPLVFAGFAILGTLFCVVVSAILAMTTKAGARNPGAERPLRCVAVVAGVAAGLSVAALLCARFVDDGPLVALIAPLVVAFEVSIVLMGASLDAMHTIYSWSSVLEREYNALAVGHARLEQELSSATAELQQLKPIVNESEKQEKSNESLHPLVNGSAANLSVQHAERGTNSHNNQ